MITTVSGHAGESLVGFSGRSEHPHSESNPGRGAILGQSWHCGQLRENGSRCTDRIAPRHG